MFRVMWRNLFARKFRLLASAFAIVLGVAFVAGSFIFTDTIAKSFDQISEGTASDVIVRATSLDDMTEATVNLDNRVISAELLDEIASVDGVARADGSIEGFGLFLINDDGKLVGGTGAPTLSFNYNDAPNTQGDQIITITLGREPQENEIAIDARTAVNNNFKVGQTISMLVPSGSEPIRKAKLVGIGEFTGGGGLAGATMVLLNTTTAQEIFLDGEDAFNSVALVSEDNISNEQLATRVGEVLPEGFEAITGEEYSEEFKDAIGVALGFLNTFLLVFAAIALVVGTFLIVNTFSILVAQRSKELALLRALGASRKQVTRSVLFEALATGVIGATAGLGLGIALAYGLKAFLGELGLDLSGTALALEPRTFIASYAVGILVTLVAAYLPARRAATIPPVAAMRDDIAMPESALRRRIIIGAVLTITGAVLMFLGLNGIFDGSNATYAVGGGILGVLIGVALLSPLLAKPLMAVLGVFYGALFKLVGRLASQNTLRNPRRTAATASALMIGLALVSTMTVLGASINDSIRAGVEDEFEMDLVLSNAINQPFSTAVGDEVAKVDGVGNMVRFQRLNATTDDTNVFLSVTDFDDFDSIFTIELIDGTFPGAANEIAVSESYAEDNDAAVGDSLELVVEGKTQDVTISGVYPDSNVLVTATAPFSLLDELNIKRFDGALALNGDGSISIQELTNRVEEAVADIPIVTVQNKTDFINTQLEQVNVLLNLIYALLGLAIVIAILGIVNTLALSVIERTREIGLLRAVGLSRRQLRRMIRLEAVAIALLGAIFGVAMGVVFGIVLQKSLAEDGITELSIPVDQLAIFVLVAAIVGILAAVLPALRAAKLNILAAISTE